MSNNTKRNASRPDSIAMRAIAKKFARKPG